MPISKKELTEENTRLKRRIEELEDRGRTVTLPRCGQTVKVQFDEHSVIGTLEIGDETCHVYLVEIKVEQLGCDSEWYLGKTYCTPGHIMRRFVLVET